ncbi:hypothetical protein KBC04_00420 [Candidatus Babeliales bacterium]|nr:hypothetical protein [Candidatus Babeliales bacterium]MBP9843444.1 hypothetical protein [Candidatus Babeliales bacterium]
MSRSIIKKTVGIGSSTLLSRFFAYIREMLLIQYLGIGVISDAFFIALRVPNSLRKVFAEGALSSVLVPALIHADRTDGHEGMNKLLTLSFVMIEAIVGLIVVGMYFFADYIVYAMAPGACAAQLEASVQFLKILAPFILFLSSSAVLAAALQATHRFFVPAIAPAFLNLLYVLFLLVGLYFSWSVSTFCWLMIVASFFNFIIHVAACLSYNFKITVPDIHVERQDGLEGMNKLLTLSFLALEILVGLTVIGMYYFADPIVYGLTPEAYLDQLQANIHFLRFLAPFILFLSSSIVLSAVLQATHRFFGLVFLSVLYVLFSLVGLSFSWSVTVFCWIISALNFLVHILMCVYYNFKVVGPDINSWQGLEHVILQLLPCLLSVGIGEINFWIDSGFASYLESGTLSLLRYAYQFVNIPLGVMVTSLSIVLLPYFSKIGHSKEELGAYLGEAIKFVVWMMLPMTIVMIFCSREIFETMFFSDKFTMHHVTQAQWNMNAYLLGLTFFALEKIILNAFYALRSTGIATTVASLTIGMNYFMNSWLMGLYGGMGLALATSITAAIRILMFVTILVYYFKIDFHAKALWKLCMNYCLQLIILGSLFIGAAMTISSWISSLALSWSFKAGSFQLLIDQNFFLHSFGYWLWFGPLAGLFFVAIYATRRYFGVSFSYLD